MTSWDALNERPHDTDWSVQIRDVHGFTARLGLRLEAAVRWLSDGIANVLVPSPRRPAELDFEVAAVFRQVFQLFLKTLDQQRSPEWAELATVRNNAGVRAAEGFELRTVFWAQHMQARAIWRAVCDDDQLSRDELHAVGDHLHRFMSHVLEAVSMGRAEGLLPDNQSGAQAVTSAILDGIPARALAAQFGIVLEDEYLVLAVHLGRHPDETLDDEAYRIQAGGRKARRVLARMARLFDSPPLSDIRAEGGVVLVSQRTTEPWPRLPWDRWSESLADAAGAPVWSVLMPATRLEDVPSAVAEAVEALRAVVTLGRPPALYYTKDIAFDVLLWRAAADDPGVGAVVAEVASEPELVETFTAYFDHDGDRRATAAALYVHPNTVDNRLAKIVTLTGLDPRTSQGLLRLHIALTMHRLRSCEGQDER